MILLKILLAILAIEAVAVGIAFVVLLNCISHSHKEEEERVLNESYRLSEEDKEH